MRVLDVVGARPNFMKVAPVHRALVGREGIQQLLAHNGQHYDINMSDVFFQGLGIPEPDVNLNVQSGSQCDTLPSLQLCANRTVRHLSARINSLFETASA